MFRMRDQQESLWQSQFLVTPKKARRLEGSWAQVFQNQALPLIDEERIAPMYCADNGRPNRAVQTALCFENHYPRFWGAPFCFFRRSLTRARSVDWGLGAEPSLSYLSSFLAPPHNGMLPLIHSV